ncbi:MAG: hypothetical protein Q6361_00600 [Candidatus Hermodarchaeota archaeon]|nr:hypothetical protein [Candidatus Hermodarchaeota archaeon]
MSSDAAAPKVDTTKAVDETSVVLSWSDRLRYLYPPFVVMLFSLFIAYIVLLANPLFFIGGPPSTDLLESILVLIVIGLIGGAATLATYIVFQHGSEWMHRVLIAAFVSPLFFILTVFIGQAVFLILIYRGLTNLHLSMIALASIMFSAFSMVFIFTDALGHGARNGLFTVYGVILGVFLGVNFTWYISLMLLVILAVQDTFFAMKLGPVIVEADISRHARSAFTFVVGPMVIGVGDLIVYASLVAFSLRYLGWFFAGYTFITVLIGCLANTQIVSKYPNKAIPGLPIPLLVSLIPIGFGLSLFMLGL